MSRKKIFAAATVFVALFAATMHAADRDATASPEQYRLRLYHLHTGEHIDIGTALGIVTCRTR